MTNTPAYSEITHSFESRDLDNRTFRHREHVQVAYELLLNYNFTDAAFRYATGIQALATKAGAPQKFNATITYAFMSLIAERMAEGTCNSFAAFSERNPDLLSKNLLEKWYDPERLHSDTARKALLLPDATH